MDSRNPRETLNRVDEDIRSVLARSVARHRNGALEQAAAGYRRILAAAPDHGDALHLLGLVCLDGGDYEQAARLIRRAAALHPAAALYPNSLGSVLLAQGQIEAAGAAFQRALDLTPGYVQAWINLGRAHRAAGRIGEALVCLERAVAIEAGSAPAQALLGQLFQVAGRNAEAAMHLEQALDLEPDRVEARHDLAGVYHDLGRLAAAEDGYRQVIARDPDAASAHNNLGAVLQELGRTAEAEAGYRRALSIDPALVSARNNLGNLLQATGRMQEAIDCYRQALAIDPDFALAHNNLGMALHEVGRTDDAIASFRRALDLAPDYAEACAHLVHQLQRACDWQALPEAEARLDTFTIKALAAGKPVAEQPFVSLVRGVPPRRQLEIARSWAGRVARVAAVTGRAFARKPAHGRDAPLIIGYLSANFRNHPMAHLMAGLFELHDRDRFRVHGYAFGPDDGSDYRRRIADGCDRFTDIDALGHAEAAERIRADGVDILVDLMGHTHGNRMAICALRPAPLQVRYLGLAGTSGADWYDYIICDRTVVPPELAQFYSEAPVYMPHCYQVNDHRQPVSTRTWTRQEAGLPETGPVLCCFNSAYKIDPVIFDAWMAVLRQVPESVLWLLEPTDTARRHLLERAAACGVDPRRLVFAPKLPKPDHLARLKLADLGLDTRLVNGAATTSDALWAGVPVVTLKGDQFASRMSASILSAAGLAELVTCTPQAYVSLAAALASDSLRLAALRHRLEEQRRIRPLFDTRRFVGDLETALLAAWRRLSANLPPAPVDIGDRQ